MLNIFTTPLRIAAKKKTVIVQFALAARVVPSARHDVLQLPVLVFESLQPLGLAA